MSDIKLIIFDFDGVIVDSEYLYTKANVIALAEAKIELSENEHQDIFLGLDYPSILSFLIKEFGAEKTAIFDSRVIVIAEDIFENELAAIPHILPYIEQCSYPYCIGSNSRTENIKSKLNILNKLHLFDGVCFGADQVANPKPAPDLFRYAADHFAVDYHHCLVVEDGVHGVHAAKELGMKSIGFTGASHVIDNHENKLMAAGAVTVLKDMSQLSQTIDRITTSHY